MKVLVCGSREWEDAWMIKDRLRHFPRGTTIITGGARGADAMAAGFALTLGFDVQTFKPDWSQGPGAGFARNIEMLDQEPDLVLAYWKDRSSGTGHTIREALKRQIPVEAWDPDGFLIRMIDLPVEPEQLSLDSDR